MFDVSISEFFDDVNKESLTPRDVQVMRDLKRLPGNARREVEEFIAFKRQSASAAKLNAEAGERNSSSG